MSDIKLLRVNSLCYITGNYLRANSEFAFHSRETMARSKSEKPSIAAVVLVGFFSINEALPRCIIGEILGRQG
jgi:hypothetical protein